MMLTNGDTVEVSIDDLIGVRTAADIAEVEGHTVRRWIKEGQLQAVQVDGRYLILRSYFMNHLVKRSHRRWHTRRRDRVTARRAASRETASA